MSQPDEKLALASFVQEEMINNTNETLLELLEQLPIVVRLRLLAFMHLMENPGSVQATLEVQASGSLRLTLDTYISPIKTQQH